MTQVYRRPKHLEGKTSGDLAQALESKYRANGDHKKAADVSAQYACFKDLMDNRPANNKFMERLAIAMDPITPFEGQIIGYPSRFNLNDPLNPWRYTPITNLGISGSIGSIIDFSGLKTKDLSPRPDPYNRNLNPKPMHADYVTDSRSDKPIDPTGFTDGLKNLIPVGNPDEGKKEPTREERGFKIFLLGLMPGYVGPIKENIFDPDAKEVDLTTGEIKDAKPKDPEKK